MQYFSITDTGCTGDRYESQVCFEKDCPIVEDIYSCCQVLSVSSPSPSPLDGAYFITDTDRSGNLRYQHQNSEFYVYNSDGKWKIGSEIDTVEARVSTRHFFLVLCEIFFYTNFLDHFFSFFTPSFFSFFTPTFNSVKCTQCKIYTKIFSFFIPTFFGHKFFLTPILLHQNFCIFTQKLLLF